MKKSSIVPRFIILILIGLSVTVPVATAPAQFMSQPQQALEDTVITAIVPAASYASDLGLIGAIAISRFRYQPNYIPYKSLTEIRLQASTKAYLGLKVMYEHTETFGLPLRSRWMANGERNPYDTYFGIGNQTEFEISKWEDRYYYFDVMRVGFAWLGRKTVFKPVATQGSLDVTATTGIRYEQPVQYQNNLINEDQPTGITGGWMNNLGIGVIWENRDSEFAATRGNRFELTGTWAPRFLFSDYPMASVMTDIRQFITIPATWIQPVLAMRVAGTKTFGTVPYWDMPYLGDELTLRGYPIFRFRGDAALFYNVELRTWLFRYPYLDFKFGIHVFHDSGRVFSDDDGFGELIRGYHRTYGGGIATSLFTPDFIVRVDAGFSDEMYRLYMNIGYMF